MIRFRLPELIADKQFREGRKVTIMEISESTGINRVTLSKLINQRGHSTVTSNLDRLCRFFECALDQLAEYVPDEDVVRASTKSRQS